MNKYEKLTEPFKLMDKAIEDFNKSTDSMFSEITYVSRLEQEVKQLKNIVKGYRFEIATLKTSLSKAGDMIEELKKENKLYKAQLRKFGKVFDRFDKTKEINQEIDIERGQEVKTNQKGE